jgi:uncharacterized protein YndB with AHSA1/START domain
MSSSTDRIEKKVLLRAPLERVWHAVTDSNQFGAWFGVAFDGPFVAGKRVTGRIAPTQVDEQVARAQEPYVGMPFVCHVETIEPMRVFSFRWNPGIPEPGADPETEPTTLVAFELNPADGGTALTITESGFDALPAERRAKAFTQNEEGWAAQAMLIEKYLLGAGNR